MCNFSTARLNGGHKPGDNSDTRGDRKANEHHAPVRADTDAQAFIVQTEIAEVDNRKGRKRTQNAATHTDDRALRNDEPGNEAATEPKRLKHGMFANAILYTEHNGVTDQCKHGR